MQDLIETHSREQVIELAAFRDIAAHRAELTAPALQPTQVAFLERRLIEGIQVIKRPDPMPALQQPLANMGTDEAGAAGDQEIHGASLIFID